MCGLVRGRGMFPCRCPDHLSPGQVGGSEHSGFILFSCAAHPSSSSTVYRDAPFLGGICMVTYQVDIYRGCALRQALKECGLHDQYLPMPGLMISKMYPGMVRLSNRYAILCDKFACHRQRLWGHRRPQPRPRVWQGGSRSSDADRWHERSSAMQCAEGLPKAVGLTTFLPSQTPVILCAYLSL